MTSLLIILLALHAVLSAAGFYWLWRKQEHQRAEIARLNELLTSRVASSRAVRAAESAVVSIAQHRTHRSVEPAPFTPMAIPARPTTRRRAAKEAATLSPETARALALSLLAVAPAVGFFFENAAAAVVTSGLAIAAAMMVVALRSTWRVAAWASVLTAGAWAAIGFALGTASAEPVSFAFGLALAGVCGLFNAHLRRASPGVTMALLTACAALALGSQIGVFGAAGAAYAVIVGASAIVGALSLRLEAIHLAAFGAAVIGIFVLSGQDGAAIWFTPSAAWAGALFLAIAAVRVPHLGARGVALAGTGAFAPLGPIFALHDARHGLADPVAAASALLALATMLACILALGAVRRERGLAALRFTRWILAAGAFIAISSASAIALPAHFAASALAIFALSLAALDARFPDRLWRAFAVLAAILTAAFAIGAARALLAEATVWPPAFAAITGLAVPALAAAGGAYLFERNGASRTAAFFEAAALLFALAAAHVLTRIAFAGGATLLQPVSFVEAATHCTLWLAASLAIAARMRHGATNIRDGAARLLAAIGLAGLIVSGVLWLVHAWPAPPQGAWFARLSLAFLIPSVLLWAHWGFWRQRKTARRARVAFAAAAASLAVFLVLEITALAALPLWAKAVLSAILVGVALGANFAPGITQSGEPLKLREKSPSPEATQAAH